MHVWTEEDFHRLGLEPPLTRTPIPNAAQDVASILDASVRDKPDLEAIVGRYRRLTYRELEAEVRAAVSMMKSMGVNAGDRVAASIGNHPDIIVAFLAAQRLGAVWMGLNVALAAPEKLQMLRDGEPVLLIAEPQVASQVGESGPWQVILCDPADGGGEFAARLMEHGNTPDMRVAVDPWGPAAIAYTSGTTGFPKGAAHSQHNIALVCAMRRHELGFAERHGIATPLTILNLMILATSALARGTTVICLERLYAPDIAEWVSKEDIGSINFAAAVLYDMLTRPDIDREGLRSLTAPALGAAHVPEAQRRMFEEFFGVVLYAYGLTEAPTGVSTTVAHAYAPPESVGKPIAQLEIQIQDEYGMQLPPDAVGEVCIGPRRSGPLAQVYTPMLGYWHNPQATAQALRDGWLRTGDLGSMDADGFLFIRGRLKDMIIRGGANIYPAEVERVILEDPDVLFCAVTGKPDERLGETVVAFIRLRDPGTNDEAVRSRLDASCRAALSKTKVPMTWVFVDEMPRNQMNKIVKQALKDRYFGSPPAV